VQLFNRDDRLTFEKNSTCSGAIGITGGTFGGAFEVVVFVVVIGTRVATPFLYTVFCSGPSIAERALEQI
jgi:hypothetical protein